MLDPTKTYSRISSIVYDENGTRILRFKSYLPDFKKLSVDAIKYMNTYYAVSPEKFELFEKEETQQLSFF